MWMRHSARAVLLGLLIAVVSDAGSTAAEPPAGVPYETALTGVEEDGLRALLEQTSSLFTLREEPPPSVIGLERRAQQDRDRLDAALRSAGFYDAAVDIRIDGGRQPALATIDVRTGPLYAFKTVTVAAAGGGTLPGGPVDGAALGLEAGQPARAAEVVRAEGGLLARLRTHGHAFAKVAERRAVVDHGDRTMDVAFTVDPGPLVRFGPTRIEGETAVDAELVRGRLPWQEGQVYDPALLDTARRDLAALGPFSVTRVTMAEAPGPDGVTPVVVTLADRPPRFVGFGVSFSSQDGLGIRGYWGHRNLFGGAEQLQLTAEVARLNAGTASADALDDTDLTFGVDFRKPDFLAPKQSLVLRVAAISDKPPAYDRTGLLASGGLERQFTPHLTGSLAVRNETSRIETTDRTWDTAYLGTPLTVSYDASDDLLNPAHGFRVGATLTPWLPVGGELESKFLSMTVSGSAYRDLTGSGGTVLAGRMQIGSIVGADLSGIPPDKRFYAGGGGSVRGYGFQMVGPRDRADHPTGGRSLLEAGAELRIKVTDTIGIVPFVDAGAVYDRAFPDFSSALRFGAGLGLRYYTDFGPLRVDVGIPLNRTGDDDAWQLYLSLGQAF